MVHGTMALCRVRNAATELTLLRLLTAEQVLLVRLATKSPLRLSENSCSDTACSDLI